MFDALDNCPLVDNPDQANTFGDERGDACEVQYFYDDFEDGIDRWTVLNGTWRTAEQAAFRGRFGLVDSINFGTANETQTIETPDIDLTMARNLRLAFSGLFRCSSGACSGRDPRRWRGSRRFRGVWSWQFRAGCPSFRLRSLCVSWRGGCQSAH